MKTEFANAENIVSKMVELEKAMSEMTVLLLGDADECPQGYEWWEGLIGTVDDALTEAQDVLMKKYGISPEQVLLKSIQ